MNSFIIENKKVRRLFSFRIYTYYTLSLSDEKAIAVATNGDPDHSDFIHCKVCKDAFLVI